MSHQHTIERQSHPPQAEVQGIIVPLDLPGLRIVSQSIKADGSIEVHVIATTDRATCPSCGTISVKIHDSRVRVKRDLPLRAHPVRLLLQKRRFRCHGCQRTFTEPDTACGRYRRTTKALRDHLALQAYKRPIAHVAQEAGVGPRFVHECLLASA